MVTASDMQHIRLKVERSFQEFCLKLVRRYWNDNYAEYTVVEGKHKGAPI